MSILFAHQPLKVVPQLSTVEIPIYIPTDLIPGILEPSIVLPFTEIQLKTCQTGEANYDATLNIFRTTDTVPQPLQVQILQSMKAKFEVDLPELDAEIVRLHSAIVDLSRRLADASAKRVHRQNIVDSCTSFSSPLRRFPSEMLREIFIHCLPSQGQPVFNEAPLSLTHVCSAWRKAALEFPFLWTSFFIQTNEGPYDMFQIKKTNKIMKKWLRRAGNHNLRVELLLHDLYDGNLDDLDQSLTDTLIPYTNRLQQFRLTAQSMNDIDQFMTQPSGIFNALESLYLDIEDLERTYFEVKLFDNAPLLREVTLRMSANPLVKLILPWNQLTSVTLFGGPINQSEMVFVLLECKQLVSGSFMIRLDHVYIEKRDQCVLEYLTDFRLLLSGNSTEIWRHDVYTVFQQLTFPALTKLTLSGKRAHLCDLPVIGFLQRAQRLQDLTLKAFHGTNDDLLSIVAYTPCVVNLRLSITFPSPEDGPQFIEALTIRPHEVDRYTYIPELQKLDLCLILEPERRSFHFVEHDFTEMVLSRQHRALQVAYLNVDLKTHTFKNYGDTSNQLIVLRNPCENGQVEMRIHDLETYKKNIHDYFTYANPRHPSSEQ